MECDIPDDGFDCVATLDIETTHYKPRQGEVVSVGVGIHDRGHRADAARYELFHRENSSVDNELDVIRRAVSYLDTCNADGLVTYNGTDFDLPFLRDRMYINGGEKPVIPLDDTDTHVDLIEPRKLRCRRNNEDWPSLEDCLASYGLPVPTTTWRGTELDNTRFGEELGPAYLTALDNGGVGELSPVIDHYLRTDLGANLAVYYADIGVEFEPELLNSPGAF